MIDLKHAVQELGYPVVHIKTDSIKIPNATPEVIQFVKDFGAKYGYEFEFDPERDIYERMCLVNDAVYIARKPSGKWEAVGAQFAHPYVFKYLFSKEALEFDDLCETKTVTTALYLQDPEDGTEPVFVGKAGRFCPIKPGRGGRILLREKDGKFSAVTGTKGWFWLESEMVQNLKLEDRIDIKYFERLADGIEAQHVYRAADDQHEHGGPNHRIGEPLVCVNALAKQQRGDQHERGLDVAEQAEQAH